MGANDFDIFNQWTGSNNGQDPIVNATCARSQMETHQRIKKGRYVFVRWTKVTIKLDETFDAYLK